MESTRLFLCLFLFSVAFMTVCYGELETGGEEAEETAAAAPTDAPAPKAEDQTSMVPLTCVKCNSTDIESACVTGKGIPDNMTETCEGKDGEVACVFIYSHVYGLTDGDEDWSKYPPVVSRFCAKEHPLQELGCAATYGIKGQQTTCLCNDKEKCNSATGRQTSLVLTVMALAVAMMAVLKL